MSLKTFEPDTSASTIAETVKQDGACIVRDVLPTEQLDGLNAGAAGWIEKSKTGGDEFTGRLTKRTGALIARVPETHDVIMHPMVVDAAREFLAPYGTTIQLHLTQTIAIFPGQTAQMLHRDRLAWGTYMPSTIEPQFNTIWALTDFTEENGATHVVPGSNQWPMDRDAAPDQCLQAEMSRGSVLCYSGSVIHGGGENRSQAPRIGMNITYALGWLRQEENQYLSCPPHIARELPSALTDLMGYTMGSYALGYYASPEMIEGLPDTLPPEMALGRMPTSIPGNALIGEADDTETAAFLTELATVK